jgi:hypothetical protein
VPPSKPHRRLSLTQPTILAQPAELTTADATLTRDPAGLATTELTPHLTEDTTLPTPITISQEPPVVNQLKGDSDSAHIPEEVVRVMAYLTSSEGQLLEDLWLGFRRRSSSLPQKPSKSDILRAALVLAAADPDALTNAISRQQTNTLSRHRNSKKAR